MRILAGLIQAGICGELNMVIWKRRPRGSARPTYPHQHLRQRPTFPAHLQLVHTSILGGKS